METSLINAKTTNKKPTFTMRNLLIGLTAVTMVVAVLGYISLGRPDEMPLEAEFMDPAVTQTTLVKDLEQD